MSAYILALVIACLAGVTMAFQGAINSGAAKIIGIFEAAFLVQAAGLVLVAALLFVFHLGDGSLARWPDASWYPYVGGILGIVILYGVMRSIPKVGVAPATTAIIIGQVLTAAAIDHLGWFGMIRIPFSWYRVLGTLLMAGGAFLLLKK